MSLIEFPFDFPGRVFRSPMPFTAQDPHEDLFTRFLKEGVSVVVLLVEDDQYLSKSGRSLSLFYRENGIEVIHLPIPDFGVPTPQDLDDAVEMAISRARQGKNLVVHCYAGLGRTGMFLACMARRVRGLSAAQAVQWVRSYLPGAIETPGQIQMIDSFGEG